VLSELEDVLFGEMDPEATRAIVLAGAGDRAFVAGADIGAMQGLSASAARDFARHGQMLTKALETLPQVVIAKVQGYALGGGCELAMACDIIVAGKSAKFGQPEVNLGIIPGFGGTQRLIRRVGVHVAMDLLLSGRSRTLSGTEAHQLGLVSRVVEDAALEDEVQKVLRGILSAGPRAIAETKRLAREAYSMSLDAGLNAEANAFAACFADDEAQEGIAAFLDKRTPAFSS
jgi:enoyl-CoA hydratase